MKRTIFCCDVCKRELSESEAVSFSLYGGSYQVATDPVKLELVYFDYDLCVLCCSKALSCGTKDWDSRRCQKFKMDSGLLGHGSERRELDN